MTNADKAALAAARVLKEYCEKTDCENCVIGVVRCKYCVINFDLPDDEQEVQP